NVKGLRGRITVAPGERGSGEVEINTAGGGTADGPDLDRHHTRVSAAPRDRHWREPAAFVGDEVCGGEVQVARGEVVIDDGERGGSEGSWCSTGERGTARGVSQDEGDGFIERLHGGVVDNLDGERLARHAGAEGQCAGFADVILAVGRGAVACEVIDGN